ncbi:unnamed protein product [Amoebophrya sp. A25]|nr:unnamed protein product [Amoebophrya sp. A25]|eukprot:GSA25T00002314001.1
MRVLAISGLGTKKFSASWKIIFFASAVTVMGGSALGLYSMIGTLASPFDIIIFSYLLLFGAVMMILDMPVRLDPTLRSTFFNLFFEVEACLHRLSRIRILPLHPHLFSHSEMLNNSHQYSHPRLSEYRVIIYKACLFLTRFIGRGVFYLFLGCMVCGNLWDNNSLPFLGFIIFGFLSAVGVCAIYYGVRLTKKLDTVRKALLNRGGPTPSICPPQGMPIAKFGELALKIQGIAFTNEELGYIANALSQSIHADDVITQAEFEFWLKNPTPVLI